MVVDGLGADQDEARELVRQRLQCVDEDAAGGDAVPQQGNAFVMWDGWLV